MAKTPWKYPREIEAVFGPKSRFRISLDPAHDAERPEFRAEEKPWFRRVKCRTGGVGAHLYVHSHSRIGFSGRGMPLRRELLGIAGVESCQVGGSEFSVTFPVSALDAVAAVVNPRTKRVLSPEAKARAVANLSAPRFAPKAPALVR